MGLSWRSSLEMNSSRNTLAVSAAEASIDSLPDNARWYAAYVQRNHEQVVANELARRQVELFFPQYVSVRQWSDRKVRLSLPLFPGYLFVRITEGNHLRVLTAPRVVKLVGNPRPLPLDDKEIEALRTGLTLRRVEPHPYCTEGARVRICRGALHGLEGIFTRKKQGCRVVVALHQVMQSFAVEIDVNDIEPVVGA